MAGRPFERTLIVNFTEERVLSTGNRQGTLTVLSGAAMGSMLVLGERTLIGRTETADLRIDDRGVSRNHACVWQIGQRFEIEDLGSSNGTFLEQGRVVARAELRDGARIGIGNAVLRFALQDEIERSASERLYQLTVRDDLTGLYNRRHFDERVHAEHAFSIRHGTALALVLLDIDHFKQINDRHGHQTGDAVLRHFGDLLQASVRTEDIVARYGGEEFVVIVRGIDVSGCQAFAERLRALIERSPVPHGGTVRLTVSIGVAHSQWSGVGSGSTGLIAAADQALYTAKRTGRNRVVVASAPISYAEGATASGQRARRVRTWEQPTLPSLTKEPRG
jgi:diguanylate cyclase (GGDEF)-like protein